MPFNTGYGVFNLLSSYCHCILFDATINASEYLNHKMQSTFIVRTDCMYIYALLPVLIGVDARNVPNPSHDECVCLVGSRFHFIHWNEEVFIIARAIFLKLISVSMYMVNGRLVVGMIGITLHIWHIRWRWNDATFALCMRPRMCVCVRACLNCIWLADNRISHLTKSSRDLNRKYLVCRWNCCYFVCFTLVSFHLLFGLGWLYSGASLIAVWIHCCWTFHPFNVRTFVCVCVRVLLKTSLLRHSFSLWHNIYKPHRTPYLTLSFRLYTNTHHRADLMHKTVRVSESVQPPRVQHNSRWHCAPVNFDLSIIYYYYAQALFQITILSTILHSNLVLCWCFCC